MNASKKLKENPTAADSWEKSDRQFHDGAVSDTDADFDTAEDMNYGKRKSLLRPVSIDDDGDDSDKETVKRKSRNLSEKKRRDQFNMLINELCSMVSTSNRKMDKTTVLKSTITFLRNQKELTEQQHAHEIKEEWKPSFLSNDEFTQLMLEALDSFLLVITQSGNVLYSSESITSLLGHVPGDIVNRSIYDFIHPDERMKIYNILTSQKLVAGNLTIPDFATEGNQLSFNCHLRCGHDGADAETVYESVQCLGNFRHWNNDYAASLTMDDNSNNYSGSDRGGPEVCFCCTVQVKACRPIRELSVIDESKREFTSRHSLEWKFLFLDHRGPPIIGWLPFEVLGTSAFEYYHPNDLERIAESHEALMQKGEGRSCYYRFLTKGQQWIWLQTRYYITYHQWHSKPEFVVCSNLVVSSAEVREHFKQKKGMQKEASMHSDISQPSSTDPVMKWGPPPKSPAALGAPKRSGSIHSVESDMMADTTASPNSISNLPSPQVSQAEVQPQPDSSLYGFSPQPFLPPSPTSVPKGITTTATLATPSPQLGQPVFMTPAQQNLQEQLWQKHQQLHQAIMQQQEELRQISEQLLLTQLMAMPQGAQVITPQPEQQISSAGPVSPPQVALLAPAAAAAVSHPEAHSTQILSPPTPVALATTVYPFQVLPGDMQFANVSLPPSLDIPVTSAQQ